MTFLFSYFGDHVGLERLDHAFYDKTMAVTRHMAARRDIVMVIIDDSSIEALGQWPWRRSVHARLLSQLHQAKAVGLDIIFTDSSPAHPQDDEALAQAIADQGRVALPMVRDMTGQLQSLPLGSLAKATAALGYINVHPDRDGVIRSVILELASYGTPDSPDETVLARHFSLAMLLAAGEGALVEKTVQHAGQKQRLINFIGYPGSFTMFPYSRVLNGDVPPEVFNNKYVLVGAWASALGDSLSAPLSRHGESMAGTEILANVLQNSLDNTWIRAPNRLLTALIAVLPVVLVCLGLRRLTPRHSFFLSVAAALLIFLVDGLLMRFAGIWVAPTASLIGVVLTYPIWSWRSQEAALRHIDDELERLQNEKGLASLAAPVWDRQSEGGFVSLDQSLPARMHKLHNALALLRQSTEQREETLRFLSHDMRSPQNSILALTQLQRHGNAPLALEDLLERIDLCAYKTLRLVDGFVQLARAESAEFRLRTTDLVELLSTVCDDRWALATGRDITIVLKTPVERAHVDAEPEMLGRALGNLLDNAIQYSPSSSQIRCSLIAEANTWLITIKDHGPGIDSSQQAALYLPFRRLGSEASGRPEGSGLGLAFVRAVAVRHAGAVWVQSELGAGSTFSVRLPASRFPAPATN